MRALIQDEFGDPASVLSVREVPLPEPRPGQVRIRTLLAPIARLIPMPALRALIAVVGFGMTAVFFWRYVNGA